MRRGSVARYLAARLNRDGRGTRVEIHPLNQSQVSRPRQRPVEFRAMNVRRWDRIVAAWAAGDDRSAMTPGSIWSSTSAPSGASTST
ncbi:hypothetical protein M2160_000128 [Streptomyces sp. SAI-117]|nr:hypothetical protein [Streptomyces sp. SAI-117]